MIQKTNENGDTVYELEEFETEALKKKFGENPTEEEITEFVLNALGFEGIENNG